MRTAFLLLGLVSLLAVPAAATAAKTPSPYVLCGPGCDPSGGYTGCKSVQDQHSSSVWLVYSVTHVLRVSYCKVNGVITQITGVYNYCDVGGLAQCTPTVAFPTGGGVGYTWATWEGHAVWTIAPANIYNFTDVLDVTIPTLDG